MHRAQNRFEQRKALEREKEELEAAIKASEAQALLEAQQRDAESESLKVALEYAMKHIQELEKDTHTMRKEIDMLRLQSQLLMQSLIPKQPVMPVTAFPFDFEAQRPQHVAPVSVRSHGPSVYVNHQVPQQQVQVPQQNPFFSLI